MPLLPYQEESGPVQALWSPSSSSNKEQSVEQVVLLPWALQPLRHLLNWRQQAPAPGPAHCRQTHRYLLQQRRQ